MPKVDLTESGVGAIHYGQIYTRYGTWTTTTHSYISPDAAAKLAKVDPGDVIITNTSENLADVGKAVAWLGDDQIVTGGHATVFKHSMNPKFVAYWLQTPSFFAQKKRLATGTKVIDVSAKALATVRIPVPPVEVQREIVKILDTFTQLDAQLEAEMEGRRQLRLAIRDRFLSSGRTDGWPQIRLSEIATQHVEPVKVEAETSYVNLGVRWYGEGAFAREAHQGREIKAKTLYRVKANQFIYNRMFVTEGSFGLITPELAHGVVSNEFPVFDLDPERVVPEWLYIRFQDSNLVRRIANEAEGGTKSRRRWKEDRFADFQINLPPIDVQREIVRVLSACADVEANLNSERLKRRQQYEYYRNRLLTFEEAPA